MGRAGQGATRPLLKGDYLLNRNSHGRRFVLGLTLIGAMLVTAGTAARAEVTFEWISIGETKQSTG